MPRSITPLLAERLDISEKRAQSLLQSMLTELRNRADTDGVQLAELGTFRKDDGTLTFVPSSSLRRRVNHQFEGLSAEDLSAPSEAEAPPTLREMSSADDTHDSTPGSPPPDEPEPGVSSSEETELPHEPEPSEKSGVPESNDEAIPTIDPIEQEEAGEAAVDETGPASERDSQPATPASEDSEDGSIPTLDPMETEEQQEGDMDAPTGHPADAPPETPTDADTGEEEPAAATEERSTFPFALVGGFVLVLLLGVGLWFYFGDGSSDETAYGSEDPQTTQAADASSQPEESSEGRSDTSDAQTDRFAGVPPDEKESSADATAVSGNWTIVVASLASRSKAEEVANRFTGRFATAEVVSGTVDGNTRYRVTLGRYDSEAAARRALKDHASSVPSGAWTYQLP